jgi:ADP-ribose pyrophosphatase YjhB (NUDIX family)
MPAGELLLAEAVTLTAPLAAILGRPGVRVPCDQCGEEIINCREVTSDSRVRCRDCSGEAYFQPINGSRSSTGQDADGRLLLARHTYPVGRSRHEIWALPGGAVEKYESIPQALRREIAQELHLDVAVERLLLVDTSEAPRLDFVFSCVIRAGQFRPSSEVATIGWFSLEEPPGGMSVRHLRLLALAAKQQRETIFT